MKTIRHPTAEKYKLILAHLGFSQQTIKSYYKPVVDLLNSTTENPYKISKSYINDYLISLKYSSISNQNQIVSAIKIYCTEILKIKKLDFTGIKRPRKESKLPNIIEREYLINCIEKIENNKHKAILALTYSIGLRRADIQNLKVKDVSSKNMHVKIRLGKGNKDAYLPLSEKILNILLEYYSEYKPKEFMFEGQADNLYSGTSLNNIVKKYIGKEYHFHNLRHSAATHWLDSGVQLPYIQEMLRHEDIKTTMMYLKVSTSRLKSVLSY